MSVSFLWCCVIVYKCSYGSCCLCSQREIETRRYSPWTYFSWSLQHHIPLNAAYLQFQQNVYRQIQGTAMGSPVSVTAANLVMEDIIVIEERALESFHTPILFLEEICWWYMYCLSSGIPSTSEQYWTINPVHLKSRRKWPTPLPGCFTIKRRWGSYLSIGLQEAHTHIFTSVHTIHSLINNR